jgi:DNA-directed RNA polymerase subunit M
MGIKYCPNCEKILVKRKVGDKMFYTCDICGYQLEATPEAYQPKKISKAQLEKRKADTMLIIADEKSRARFTPIDSNIKCYRCGSHKIEYFQQQIHRADESTTTFFRCSNCGNRWRMG